MQNETDRTGLLVCKCELKSSGFILSAADNSQPKHIVFDTNHVYPRCCEPVFNVIWVVFSFTPCSFIHGY